MRKRSIVLGAGVLGLLVEGLAANPPVMSNLRAAQRADSPLVDIYYDVAGRTSMMVSVAISIDGGQSYRLPAASFSGDGYGANVAPGNDKHIVWDAARDWNRRFSRRLWLEITAEIGAVTSAMGRVRAGNAVIGQAEVAEPVHTAQVSAFYMDGREVSQQLWDEVYYWAIENDYAFDNEESGSAPDLPVLMVNWHDAVKWCNARSEMDNLTPLYYLDAGHTTVYRSGSENLRNEWVLWTGSGYRLPTETEWEKAARGGLAGRLYPWGDTIADRQANYWPSRDPYETGQDPELTPVGYYNGYQVPAGLNMANGYGLYDLAGNTWEWCWDWWNQYAAAASADPRGPETGTDRVLRGGSWADAPGLLACALRASLPPAAAENDLGFRCVRVLSEFASARVGPLSVLTRAVASLTGVGGADYDGDGRADPAFFCETIGWWRARMSGAGYAPVDFLFGGADVAATGGRTPVAADYDGDGRADPALYEAFSGAWCALLSSAGYAPVLFIFGGDSLAGAGGLTPLAADFDGDGRADPALYQNESGWWGILLSGSGYAWYAATFNDLGGGWGLSAAGAYGPAAADFDGDGRADPAVYQSATGNWRVQLSGSGYASLDLAYCLGGPGFTPVPADYDGDGRADPAVYQDATGQWQIMLSGNGYVVYTLILDVPGE